MNLFEVVKASINTRGKQHKCMELMSITMVWHCVRSIMTVIRACIYRMTTTTVLPVESMEM